MNKVLKEIKHPLVQHKLSLMRKKGTSTRSFRVLAREVGLLLAYEVTQDLPLEYEEIETPLQKMQAPFLEGKKLCLVPILRAGIGLLDGFLGARFCMLSAWGVEIPVFLQYSSMCSPRAVKHFF